MNRYLSFLSSKTLLLIALLSTLAFVLSSCGDDKPTQETISDPRPEPVMLYGICVDTLSVDEGVVANNEFLSSIMTSKGVSYSVVDHIARNHRSIFDVKKIRGGHKYVFIRTTDSLQKPLFWVYEIDSREYAVFSLTDSLNAWRGVKPMDTVIERSRGVIQSSLWNAMAADGGDPYLSVKLSDIYAWTIDFFGIQKGDSYDAIYERLYVEGKAVGYGRVLSCVFNHSGSDLWAFCFEQNGHEEYFDANGVSLRKAFLKAPLNYSRISSKFTNNRYHPVLKINRPHHGVDYAAPAGTPVYSIGDGVVIAKAYQKGGGGNYLKIKHNSVYTTVYMHLQGYAKGISNGTRVKQGQLIGYVGSTGIATGPHLDFRVYKNGTPIDPLKMESPPTDPVRSELMPQYRKMVDYWMNVHSSDGCPSQYVASPILIDSI